MGSDRAEWESSRLRTVLDQLTDAVVVLDRDFRFVYANAVALSMVRKRLEQIVGVSHWDLLPHLRDGIVWKEYHQAVETGEPRSFEYQSRTGRWLQARAFPSPEGLVFHLTDVTDRRAVEAERERREGLVKAMLDAMPQIAWAADLDGSPTYFNARWYAYTGLSPEGEYSPAAIIHPEDLDRTLSQRSAAYDSGNTYETQVRIRRHDGAYRWHLTRAEPMRDAAGQTTGYVGTSTDMHEQRLLVEELRRAQRDLSLTADAVPELVAFVTPELDYGFVNRTFETWFALRREQVLGRSLRDVLGEELFEGLRPTLERALGGERSSLERWVLYPDGVRRHIHADYLPRRDDTGRVEGFYVLSTDITERTLRAEALERRVADRTADLQAANEALQGFTYHVAHDLRSPLRAIASTSHMIREDYAEILPEDAQALLVRQATAAGKLGQLIDDLLRLSRLSREELVRSTLDFTAIAGEAVRQAQSLHPESEVRCEVMPRLTAYADARLLQLALINLVENALKYSPEGGTVRIGQRTDGTYFVSDEGIGIDPRYAERIFEPFQRLHRDDEFLGTGIGLSNVRQVILRHGGRVWVESELGHGSSFLFTLGQPF